MVIAIEGNGAALRCRVADAGRFVVSWSQLAELPASDVTLAVERSARAPFAATGLDAGELLVTVRDVVPMPAD